MNTYCDAFAEYRSENIEKGNRYLEKLGLSRQNKEETSLKAYNDVSCIDRENEPWL